eukprot:COSAG02_NODE_122_length_35306_cov_98.280967_13_plen_59_part_00
MRPFPAKPQVRAGANLCLSDGRFAQRILVATTHPNGWSGVSGLQYPQPETPCYSICIM